MSIKLLVNQKRHEEGGAFGGGTGGHALDGGTVTTDAGLGIGAFLIEGIVLTLGEVLVVLTEGVRAVFIEALHDEARMRESGRTNPPLSEGDVRPLLAHMLSHAAPSSAISHHPSDTPFILRTSLGTLTSLRDRLRGIGS